MGMADRIASRGAERSAEELRAIVAGRCASCSRCWHVAISEAVLAVYREAARAAAPPDIGITAWAAANRIWGIPAG